MKEHSSGGGITSSSDCNLQVLRSAWSWKGRWVWQVFKTTEKISREIGHYRGWLLISEKGNLLSIWLLSVNRWYF